MESKRTKAIATAALLALVAGCLVGFPSGAQQNQKATIEAGQRVFAGSCGMSYCHGFNGIGGGGPKLRDREFTAASLTRMIANGIPGTSMPAFKTSLKPEQIEQVVAFLFTVNKEIKRPQPAAQPDSHLSPTAAPAPVASAKPREEPAAAPGARASLAGDARAGEAIFFDPSQLDNCRVCHTLHGRGGAVASDLTRLSQQPPREILQRILAPKADDKYPALRVTLKTGERLTGIRRDEDAAQLRLYDTSSLPPVSRGLLKSEIETTEKLAISGCPGDYASKFTLKQLLDLVAFIKTADPARPAPVSLRDLF
jgi:putative heme-binding domain-containing protein